MSEEERHFEMLFEYAPIALMEQDFSAIRQRFEALRAEGVNDLEAFLQNHPEEIDRCMGFIRVVRINQHTLKMYGVPDRETFLANLPHFFRDDMRRHFREELLALWQGALTWSGEGINYTLQGNPFDVLLSWRILPGAEETWQDVLVSLEDLTVRRNAERALEASANRLRGLFENSPISLWEEDYSQIKAIFNDLRSQGVEDLRDYLVEHPEVVTACMQKIRVLEVNRKTLELFGASSVEDLRTHADRIFRDEMREHFARELVHLWEGELSYEAEGINYTLQGEPLYVHLHLSVYPGSEETFERVLVALEDVTSRHKAEEYLRYLGTHDVMTGLYNRAHFQDEMKRLNEHRSVPVTLLIADLDRLKLVNDTLGHDEGDKLIRRAAEVLKAAFGANDLVARIGGDEFAVLMMNADEQDGREAIARLETLIRLNNRFYGEPRLSLSMGFSVSQPGENLELAMRRADTEMYRNKREHHHEG